MIRTSFKLTFFLAVAAGPALAESTPATSPDVPALPLAVEAPAAVDAFGLPCEVTFAPKAAPANGKKAKRAKEKPAPAVVATTGLGRGNEFALGRADRGPSYTVRADAEVRMQAATLTPAMVGIVVRENATAVELCMTKLPVDARAATVGLHLTIEATGQVSATKVTGAPKASAFVSCLSGAAKTWAFPHTDAVTEIEYPIVINGR